VFPLALPNYGTFASTVSQINPLPINYATVSFDTALSANNFSIAAGSRITAAADGVYNFEVTLQVIKTDTGTDTFEYWLALNNVDLPNTNRAIKMHSNDSSVVASISWTGPMFAGDFLEVRWYSQDTAMQLLAVPAVAIVPGVSPARPLTPSALVTVSQVGA
jgi:hypothetical protein